MLWGGPKKTKGGGSDKEGDEGIKKCEDAGLPGQPCGNQ